MLQNQGTVVVNGQLVGAIPGVSQNVTGYAPYSAISPAGPLTLPPSIGTMGSSMGGTPTNTADSNAQAVQIAKSDPFNIKKSPVVPAVIFLGVALFALHSIHFREGAKVSESAE